MANMAVNASSKGGETQDETLQQCNCCNRVSEMKHWQLNPRTIGRRRIGGLANSSDNVMRQVGD